MRYNDKDWQEALDRIEQAKAEGGKMVNLSGLDITEIPDELFELAPTLETLNLIGTQITDAAPLAKLTNLTELYLSDTPAAKNPENVGVFNAMQDNGCEIYGIEELMR